MTDVVIEKKGHVAIVKIEHMKAMNALSTDMYAHGLHMLDLNDGNMALFFDYYVSHF